MNHYIDLHVHSTCSDGTLTPEAVVQLAIENGIRVIALTDHDTAEGVSRAQKAAGCSLDVIPGIEISAEWKGNEIHILGLDIDPDHPALKEYQDEFVREKEIRNAKIAQKITEAGCPITVEEVEQRFPGAIIGRPHYARIMMEKGFVTSVNAAFAAYLGDHGPCYVGRRRIDVRDAVKLIRKCGGHPVMAHPFQYGFSKDLLESIVNLLTEDGLEGLECYYPRYTATDSDRLCKMAKRHGLFVTGGSDFHGANKPEIQLGSGVNGNLRVNYELLETAGLR